MKAFIDFDQNVKGTPFVLCFRVSLKWTLPRCFTKLCDFHKRLDGIVIREILCFWVDFEENHGVSVFELQISVVPN